MTLGITAWRQSTLLLEFYVSDDENNPHGVETYLDDKILAHYNTKN